MKKLLRIAESYFELWNEHNLTELSKILTPDVILLDWDVEILGREGVLIYTAEVFKNIPNISVEVVDTAFSEKKVMAEILVKISGEKNLSVVDVLSIRNDKIFSIKAYKI